MNDRRIRVPKDTPELIERLKLSEDGQRGVFKTYADLMTFAAMIGYKHNKYLPFEGSLIDPIRQDVFVRQGHDRAFYLLALVVSNKPEYLSETEEAENKRVDLFEGYANGGLEYLKEQLHGKDDVLDHLLLLMTMGINRSSS